jgi:hypothetical protein
MNTKIKIHQIYYDETSRKKVSQLFLPLDNLKNPRPDWYEFWVIRNFLLNNALDEDTWYGFLSPNFSFKSSLEPDFIINLLSQAPSEQEVMLFSYAWDQICYFKSVWEQGDLFHPGLIERSEQFFNTIGLDIQLSSLISLLSNSVFSYYFAAKKRFWLDWLAIADPFFHFCEKNPDFQTMTTYGLSHAPIKTFIQERIPTLILSTRNYNTACINPFEHAPLAIQLKNNDIDWLRKKLTFCHFLKSEYLRTQNSEFLTSFFKHRDEIKFDGISSEQGQLRR